MTDIKTLRAYRNRGVRLTNEEKIRLCQDDTRRLRELQKIARKAAWIGAVISVATLICLGGYITRGYTAVGAEILVPAAAVFAHWIRTEEKENEDPSK